MNRTAVLSVSSSRGAYNVKICKTVEQSIDELSSYLKYLEPSAVVVFSNPTVFEIYGSQVLNGMGTIASVHSVLFPDGEQFKTLETIQEAIVKLDRIPLDRKACFIALGGGVVGDMTGFLSSIYVRGVNWIQVPTTLLAMVDSSVGGKTGVNLPSGKNRIGSFYPPNLVCTSPMYLQTLDKQQVTAGFGEVFKHCILDSKQLVDRFMVEVMGSSDWLAEPSLSNFILVNCDVKARIVETDELEKGLRMCLNYGHTVGHALERVFDYGVLLHGHAVMVGMWIEAAWASNKGWTPPYVVETLKFVNSKLDMSIEINDTITTKTMFDAISFDKKMQCDKLQIVVVEEFGRSTFRTLEHEEIAELSAFTVRFLQTHFSSARH